MNRKILKHSVKREAEWLDDYALFMALKDANHGAAWFTWDRDLKFRKAEALEKVKEDKSRGYCVLENAAVSVLSNSGRELKDYANVRGIKIIGDVPIYVAGDSADVWANPEQFYLNEDLEIDRCRRMPAGCVFRGRTALGKSAVPLGRNEKRRLYLVDKAYQSDVRVI